MKLDELINRLYKDGMGEREELKIEIFNDQVKNICGEILFVGELDFNNFIYKPIAQSINDILHMKRNAIYLDSIKNFGDVKKLNDFIENNIESDYCFVVYEVEGNIKFKETKLE